MTTPQARVLVGPLQQSDRREALLLRVAQVPEHLQVVLRGCYLQPRPAQELAGDCGITVRELLLVRADALTALARTRQPAGPARPRVASPFH